MKNDEALKDILALSAEPTEGQMSIDDFLPKPKRGNVPVTITEDQIDEAMISAFMKQYAAALDAGTDAFMEQCAGDEFPPELDARCRALIEQAGGSTHSGEAERAWQSFVQNYLPESPEDLTFKSNLTMEEIERNFEGVDLFTEVMAGLEEALVYSKDKEDLIDPGTGIKLTPSPGGRECLGNGEWPGYEICCDECDHFFTCFPEEK